MPANSASLSFGGSGSSTYTSTNNISSYVLGAVSLTSTSTGTDIIAGNSFNLGASSSISQDNTGAFTIQNGFGGQNTQQTLTLTGNGTGLVTLSGVITEQNNGAHNTLLTKTGTSTFVLSGANTFSGATSINAGIINYQNSSAFGSDSGVFSAITVASGATAQLQGGITSTANALTISGTGASNATGALENVSGANNYTGSVNLGAAAKISSDAGTLTLSGAIANGGFAATFDGPGNITASGLISGTGSLVKTGAGTLVLSNASNSYTGITTINAGTVSIGTGTNLGTAPGSPVANQVTIDGGTLATTGTFTFATNRGITLGASGGTVDVASATTLTAPQIITGTGTLLKAGPGTLVLSGANTYTGATTVSAGTLFVNNSTGSGTGTNTVTVNGTGTLSGSGTISGAVNVSASGATINPGATAGAIGTLSTGALTLSNSSVFSVDMLSGSGNADQINVTGAVTITSASLQLNIPNGTVFAAGQTYTLINNDLADAISGTFSNAAAGTDTINGYEWIVTYTGGDGNDFVLTAVPEPSTWLAASLALGAIGFSQRKRLRPCASSGGRKHS